MTDLQKLDQSKTKWTLYEVWTYWEKSKADVDKSMVPYFGSYGASIKQAMHCKPL